MAVDCWQGKCTDFGFSKLAGLAGFLTGAGIGIAGYLSGTWGGLAAGAWGGALAVALGFIVGCSARLAGRLKKHPEDPKVSVPGMIIKAWKMDGPYVPSLFGAAWDGDGDWCFNLMIPESRRELIEEHVDGGLACIRCQTIDPEHAKATGLPEGASIKNLHCEISSRIGTGGCIGTMVGAVVGAAIGIPLGIAAAAAACAALGIATFGIGLLFCALIAAVVAAAVTWAGATLGGLIGSGIGAAADAGSEEAQLADTVSLGDCVIFSGDWVTDLDHGWNEIHELEGIVPLGPCRSIERAVALAATKDIDDLY